MATLNISKAFRAEAYIKDPKDRFNVSPEAVNEYLDRILAGLEVNVPAIAKIAHDDGRKTILPRDVIQFFSYMESSTEAPKKTREEGIYEFL